MLFLLCTAGVEIMRHSSVAARAPRQTHTVCIRYLRFCKGSGERCTQPDAYFDRGETETIGRLDTCVAGVVLTRVPVMSGDTASSLGPRGWAGKARDLGNLGREEWWGFGEIIMRTDNWNAVWWLFSLLMKKIKSDLWPAHSPNTWVTGNYLAAQFSTLSPDSWLGAMKWAAQAVWSII